jgi:tight adherence protein B
MSSQLIAFVALFCFMCSIFLFFKNTYNVFLNTIIRKFWFQAEKCFINFELMFLDQTFTMEKCRILIIVSMITFGFLAFLITISAPSAVPLVAIIIATVIGWVVPGIVTSTLHKYYVSKFDDQLLDAMGMIGSGLRSGLSLQQAMGLVADEMPKPVSQEFQLMLSEYNYGKTLDEAYQRISKRVPSDDLGIVTESILVLRSTGANLVETFDIIIDTIRERKKIEGKIKSMTALGIIQGFILGSMPFVLMIVFRWLNPEYMDPLFHTTIGWAMLGVVVLLVAMGGVVIKSIITIDV